MGGSRCGGLGECLHRQKLYYYISHIACTKCITSRSPENSASWAGRGLGEALVQPPHPPPRVGGGVGMARGAWLAGVRQRGGESELLLRTHDVLRPPLSILAAA